MQHMRRFRHKGKALQVARPNWSELPDPSARVDEVTRTAPKSWQSSLESWLDPQICERHNPSETRRFLMIGDLNTP